MMGSTQESCGARELNSSSVGADIRVALGAAKNLLSVAKNCALGAAKLRAKCSKNITNFIQIKNISLCH